MALLFRAVHPFPSLARDLDGRTFNEQGGEVEEEEKKKKKRKESVATIGSFIACVPHNVRRNVDMIINEHGGRARRYESCNDRIQFHRDRLINAPR